jgi:hypothetical protein
MPRIEDIIKKYGILRDYEWRVKFGDKEYDCEPVFRSNPAYDREVVCWPSNMDYLTAKFYNAVRYMEWEEFLAWLPPIIDRIVVERDADPIRYFYNVKNSFSKRKQKTK